MEISVYLKIKENSKLLVYLRNHSSYYRLLNRDSSFYDTLVKEYKKDKRNNEINKLNETIDNVEMISDILKLT